VQIDAVPQATPIEELAGASLVGEQAPSGLLRAGWARLGVKRAIDIFGSFLMLVILLPVMLVSAVLVASTSRGGAFFVQERVGKGGARFRMLKFRSMRRGAPEARADLLDLNEATGPVFKVRDDPRLTAVGRLIRRLSIDELPQLVNVLLGHMSLVGPRPPLAEEVETYDVLALQRLSVKPGITCIWQVSGRSDLDFDTWLEMDLRYIREWSLGLDVKLLLATVPAVLTGRGAY
jgi:lipopolysaccharide/colanic/teichoic acid biosynthesis glycosyltransferase